eukprot:12007356-Alexandrium_andersonii.AAC.1
MCIRDSTHTHTHTHTHTSAEVLRAHRWAAQVLTRGPWQAYPQQASESLKAFGFPVEFLNLPLASLAARYRNGVSTCPAFRHLVQEVRRVADSDDAMLASMGTGLDRWFRYTHL